MLRKLGLWLIFVVIAGGAAYGYLYYGIISLWDKKTVKITHMYVIKKPERSTSFYWDHSDPIEWKKKLRRMKQKGITSPWHMDYEWIVDGAIYDLALDSRAKGNM